MKSTKGKKLSAKELQYLIKTCMDIEYYEEAYKYTVELLTLKNGILTEEERNLFSRSTKAKFNIYRNSWKTLIDYYNFEEEKIFLPKDMTEAKREELETQIKSFCLSTITTIDKYLLKNLKKNDVMAEIFYLQMKADYYRYLGEIMNESDYKTYFDECKSTYNKAYELCKLNLDFVHPLFLTVALNYSMFLYSLAGDLKLAYEKCNDVYKQAMTKLSPEKKNPEVESIIKAIQENLTIWKIELADLPNS